MLAERAAFPRTLLLAFVACTITAWRFGPSRVVFSIGDDGGFADREGVEWPLGTPFAGATAPGLSATGLSNCHEQESSGVVAIVTCDAHSGRYVVARIEHGGESYWKAIGPSATTEAGEIVTFHTRVGEVHAMTVTTRSVAHGHEVVWDYELLFGFGPTQKLSVYEPILSGRIAGQRPTVSYRIEITEDGVATITGSSTYPDGTPRDDRRSGPLGFP